MSAPPVLRALVADDEPLAREAITMLLGATPDVRVGWEAADGAEAADLIRRHRPDLVFLDVQMPGLDGFGVVERVGPEAMPATVFVTAFDRYALRAFDVAAVDYLVKPFDDARFARALTRACARARAPAAPDVLRALLGALRPPALDRFLVREGPRLTVVHTDAVDWAEAAGDYVALHVGGRTHLHRETLAGLEAGLDPARFVRVHRTVIVNVDRVRDLRPTDAGDAVVRLHDGTELRASRRYRDVLEARLGGVR